MSEPLRSVGLAVFHLGRSGSTVLGNLLAQHPHVHWFGEVFERAFKGLEARGWQWPMGFPASPGRFLATALGAPRRRVEGVEAKFCQLRQAGLPLAAYLAQLEALGFRHHVVLERRNALRKVVSSIVLREHGALIRRPGNAAQLHQVHVDVAAVRIDRECKPLLQFLDDFQQDFRRLRQALSGRAVLELSYEEDVERDPRIAAQRVCDFAGLQPCHLEVRLERVNPYPLERLIRNYDDVRSALAGSVHAWMLE